MTLVEQTLFGQVDKVQIAIERLRMFEPSEGYYLAFSGGKDSVTIKALADMAKVKYDAHYNVTTIDPPELVWFIKQNHKDVAFGYPPRPFLVELVKRGFPQRTKRWCCELYKERGGYGRLVMTGVRAAESVNRARRSMVEGCYKSPTRRFIHPIIDWNDNDVWQFIREYSIPYCKLYDEGWERIGCLLCPFAKARHRKLETELYPRITRNFIKAFEKLYDKKKSEGKRSVDRWKSGEEMFWWWIDAKRTQYSRDQISIFD